MNTSDNTFKAISKFNDSISFDKISVDRKNILQPLIDYIQHKVDQSEEVNLNFICTHNSRRSHLSQIWAQVAANYYKIPNITCYSGGTETTAMFSMIGETLKKQGFQVTKIADVTNPVFAIKYTMDAHPVICFSKTYDDSFNPVKNFAAIMTCSSANEACPFIPGSEKRIAVTYEDPKAFDDTPQQAEKYLERSIQIATEMHYVFSSIK